MEFSSGTTIKEKEEIKTVRIVDANNNILLIISIFNDIAVLTWKPYKGDTWETWTLKNGRKTNTTTYMSGFPHNLETSHMTQTMSVWENYNSHYYEKLRTLNDAIYLGLITITENGYIQLSPAAIALFDKFPYLREVSHEG